MIAVFPQYSMYLFFIYANSVDVYCVSLNCEAQESSRDTLIVKATPSRLVSPIPI